MLRKHLNWTKRLKKVRNKAMKKTRMKHFAHGLIHVGRTVCGLLVSSQISLAKTIEDTTCKTCLRVEFSKRGTGPRPFVPNELKPRLVTKRYLAETQHVYACPECAENTLKMGDNFCSCCGLKVRWPCKLDGELVAP